FFFIFFFFQAEDGIRDRNVTGVQTCALPILSITFAPTVGSMDFRAGPYVPSFVGLTHRVKGRQYIRHFTRGRHRRLRVGRDAATGGFADKPKSSCAMEVPL